MARLPVELVPAGIIVVLIGILVAAATPRTEAAEATEWARLATQDVHSLRFPGPGTDRLLFGHHGGVLRSEDGGRDWTPLDLEADAMGLDAAPDGSVVVAGHEVLTASSDGGDTWHPIETDLPSLDIHAFARSLIDPNRMWAYVSGAGIHESTDAGRTWSRVNERDVVQLAATRLDGRDVLFGVDPFSGLIRSQDGARTWEVMGTPPVSPVTTLAADTAGSSLVMGGPSGLHRSEDGGRTWRSILGLGTVLAAAVAGDGSTIAAVTEDTRLYRSDDGGATWPGPMLVGPNPAPTPIRGADPRGGMSATMTGDPVGAALAVIILGALTAFLTAGYVLVSARLRR